LYFSLCKSEDWLVRGSISERYAFAALRVELRGSHQVYIIERTRFVCAARENIVKAVTSQPILGDCPDGFVAQRYQRE
jgi:hypothetical protein